MAESRPDLAESELASAELRAARPAIDRVAMAAARARAERALLGAAAPARLGRYLVIDRLAGGGMGVVYRGYDPELHRKVALKVVHPRQQDDDRAHARMLAEARALAKLDHVNVVKLHDVLTVDAQLVIVMELIEGVSLAEWERSAPRTVREIVEVYAQAGEGLAAAHGVGVVHRDFKPANAVLGADGRVRVLDFGLARDLGNVDVPLAAGSPDGGAADPALTATGEVVGTLAYSAPEQLAGAPATAASDQFSFGVALHRALEGRPPFAGTDAASLAAAIRDGTVQRATDGRTVPIWLRALVTRALAADPSARFSSMAAVVAELRRSRGLRRWRVPLAILASLAVAAVALVAAVARPARGAGPPPCDGGAAEIARVWNPEARATVLGALAAAGAAPERDAVVSGLDRYRDRWRAIHRASCEANRHGRQSDALFERRMICLGSRRGDLEASVDVLRQLDRDTAIHALDVVRRLPALDACEADEELMQSGNAPPPGATSRAQLADVRARISRAAALDRAGRSVEALFAASDALSAAWTTGHVPVIAEAALERGRVLLKRRDFRNAQAQLLVARGIGLQYGLLALAVEAAARMIYAEAMYGIDLPGWQRELAVLEPLAQRLPGDRFARPLLLNNVGTAYMSAGDRSGAARYFAAAHDALAGVADPDIELTCIDENRAMVAPDDATREDLSRAVWERRRAELGPAHLDTLDAMDSYARRIPELARALPLITEICDTYDRRYADRTESRAYCHSYRAFASEHTGQRDDALAIHDAIVAFTAGHDDHSIVAWGQLARAHALRLRGDRTRALAAYAELARDRDDPAWWMRARAAEASLEMGLLEVGHDDRRAAAHLEAAAQELTAVTAISTTVVFRLQRDRARQALADLATGTRER